jgi:hypothetical protein
MSGDGDAERAWSDYADMLRDGWPRAYWENTFRLDFAWKWSEAGMDMPPYSLTWDQVAALMLGLEHGEIAWQGVWEWDEVKSLASRGLMDKDHKLTRLGRIVAGRIMDRLDVEEAARPEPEPKGPQPTSATQFVVLRSPQSGNNVVARFQPGRKEYGDFEIVAYANTVYEVKSYVQVTAPVLDSNAPALGGCE